MTTAGDWVEDVRAHLIGDQSEEANQVSGTYTAGGTLTLTHALGNIAAGALISIGLNTLRVMSVSGQIATVIGGYAGTTDANATTGTLVRVNPRFTDHRILRALNSSLASMSSPDAGLFAVDSTLVTKASGVEGYDLNIAGLVKILEVRRQKSGVSLAWPRVRATDWEVDRTAPTGDFTHGLSIRVTDAEAGYSVQVVYGKQFVELAALADNVTTTLVPTTAYDIPALGAALRLIAPREIPRNATRAQGGARRQTEVPAGAVGNSYRGLQQEWARRIQEEARRLRSQYPVGK